MSSPSPTCVLFSLSTTVAVLSTSFNLTRAATPCRPPTNSTESTPPNKAKMSRTCLSVQLAGKPRTRMHGAGASPLSGFPSSRFLFLPFSFTFSPALVFFSFAAFLPSRCSTMGSARACSTLPCADTGIGESWVPCVARGFMAAATARASRARRVSGTPPVSSRSQAKRSGPVWKPSKPNAGRPSQPSPTMVREGHRVSVRSPSRRSTSPLSASKANAPFEPACTRSESDQDPCTSPPSSSMGYAAIMAAASLCNVKRTYAQPVSCSFSESLRKVAPSTMPKPFSQSRSSLSEQSSSGRSRR
mmetsp:Transcript_135778/g.378388  ORF Transcript_135778/g.378388 Transcript_135778/m.378388 type:complete len:302 (+) Transcript_135778:384-1289(+)